MELTGESAPSVFSW